jgi:hypothetical protein
VGGWVGDLSEGGYLSVFEIEVHAHAWASDVVWGGRNVTCNQRPDTHTVGCIPERCGHQP